MARETTEELLIRRIEIDIKAIKNGKLSPRESEAGARLNRLKKINLGMYEDLLGKYSIAVNQYQPAKIPASKKANK